MHFARKFSRGPQAQERTLLGYISIYENTPKKLPHLPPKSWNNFIWWFKKEPNWGIAKVMQVRLVLRLYANTSSPSIYWRKQLNQQAHLELCHRNPDILERMLNRIALSNSTAGKCAPMQVIKQPEHGRTSTTKEQKCSSFQTKYD